MKETNFYDAPLFMPPLAEYSSDVRVSAEASPPAAPPPRAHQSLPPCSVPLPGVAQATLSAHEEASLIIRALHAETIDNFREAIDSLIDPDEQQALHEAEEHGLVLQAAAIFDRIVRQKLPRRFAELIGWRTPSGLAEVVERAKNLTPSLRVTTLKMFGSRGFTGRVALQVRRSAREVADPFPKLALLALADMTEAGYFKQIAYLEPLFHEGRLLRSQAAVRRSTCRPIDPIIAGFLGCGPVAYGYDLRDRTIRDLFKKRDYRNQPPVVVMLIAHWD